MQMEIQSWMADLSARLQDAFGGRLLFLGLQGSRGRGEAGPDSDIDLVAVLDSLSPEDLDRYKAVLGNMPEGELACGFVCGKAQLTAWPAYDLLTLMLDTKPFLGDLRAFIPLPGRQAALEAVRIGAANLYHGLCHGRLFTDAGFLESCHKAAFFLLRAIWYLETGAWPPTGRSLEMALAAAGEDTSGRILGRYRRGIPAGDEDEAFRELLEWAGGLLPYYKEDREKEDGHALSL